MKHLVKIMAATLLATQILPAQGATLPINIVAGENFYGDVAQQIGGSHVHVTSILSNPDQDPHLFEASATTAKALNTASLVVYNGVDYDPWMEKLLSASKAGKRKSIIAGVLLHRKKGVNPHLWYDPATMPLVATAIARELENTDPTHKAEYQQHLATFLASMQAINSKIKAIRSSHAGTPVTATEPVIGYLSDALGLSMRNQRFQLAVMNDTEPSASDIAAFENDLKTHKVKVLFYNSQASDSAAKRVQGVALKAKVPVLGVTETEPAGKHYQDWMSSQLDAIALVLARAKP
jgi:zinc/manganese transport system substrate-binding protein